MKRSQSLPTFMPHNIARILRRSFSSSPIHNHLTPFTRRLFKLPPPPSPPSLHHHDLPSFLSYAERTSLPPASTTYTGTHYEYTVLDTLRRFAFTLHRIGGRDDAGIDLVGTWHLPHLGHQALRVFVQCKALKTKLGPNLVRELEGTFRNAPVGWRTGPKIGILVSPREATKGVRDAMARSAYPVFWMMMEKDGTLRQALWNGKAEELGLGALGVETRYAEVSSTEKKKIVLTWDGEDLPHMDHVEREMAHLEAKWLALWGRAELSESSKLELLDIVENSFPDLLLQVSGAAGTGGYYSALSEADKVKVLQLLENRLHGPAL